MKRMFKKALSVLLAVTMVLGMFAFAIVDVDWSEFMVIAEAEDAAETFSEGYYTYSVDEDGNATITNVDTLISGDIVVPSTLDNHIVTEIGSQSFMNCDKITSVIFPNGILKIGHSAFFRCDTLESVFIPESVEYIGSRAFQWCPNLIRITVDPKNLKYSSDEYDVFFNEEKTTLIQCPSNIPQIEYRIPNGVINIENEAFLNCKKITNIVVPNGVTKIGSYAFAHCDNLAKIILPNSLISIGIYAFYLSNSLSDVYFCGTEEEWNAIEIGSYNNDGLENAMIHYNYVYNENSSDHSIKKDFVILPSTKTVSYGDSIILHADVENLPEGAYIEWSANNSNFKIVSCSADGSSCTVTPEVSGDTTFTATIYDKDGNEIGSDTQTMTAKAGFFQKIIAFFKKIFGLTKVIPEMLK
ncbi:MAG: leucine-rich repeat domain-containing protein [Clostridia bacterium]|nr:leucine-rich repeat domain-containing protein [Clostridia bacterium]